MAVTCVVCVHPCALALGRKAWALGGDATASFAHTAHPWILDRGVIYFHTRSSAYTDSVLQTASATYNSDSSLRYTLKEPRRATDSCRPFTHGSRSGCIRYFLYDELCEAALSGEGAASAHCAPPTRDKSSGGLRAW